MRRLAIAKVGIKAIRHPIKVAERSGGDPAVEIGGTLSVDPAASETVELSVDVQAPDVRHDGLGLVVERLAAVAHGDGGQVGR